MSKNIFHIVVNTEFSLEENLLLEKILYELTELIVAKNHLNIKRLDKIILTQYFDEQLKHLSIFFDDTNIKYTNNKNSIAIAKNITLLENGEFIDILVLSNYFIQQLLNDSDSATHLLHHELVHIHEQSILDKIIYEFNHKKLSELENNYLPTSMSAWNEYYANFLSSSTITTSMLDSSISNFKQNLLELEKNVIEKRTLYRDGELDIMIFFHQYFKNYSDSLYLSASYIIGYCHGLNKTLKELSSETDTILDNHLFKVVYLDMEKIFKNMLNQFPEKWDEKIYDELNINILNYYSKLGVSFREINDNGIKRVWTDIFEP